MCTVVSFYSPVEDCCPVSWLWRNRRLSSEHTEWGRVSVQSVVQLQTSVLSAVINPVGTNGMSLKDTAILYVVSTCHKVHQHGGCSKLLWGNNPITIRCCAFKFCV